MSSYQGAEKGSAPSDSDGAMRTEGSPMIPDDAMVGKDSLKDWRVIRDCFHIPYQPREGVIAWFLADTCFVKIQRFPGTIMPVTRSLKAPCRL